jgi:hypothetical protein
VQVNAGWGAQLGVYSSVIGDNPSIIFNIWDSMTNLPQDRVNYVSDNICNTTVNKRLCAFLPLTNCSMPSHLTSHTGREARMKIWGGHEFLSYTNASINGMPLPTFSDDGFDKPFNMYQENMDKSISKSITPLEPSAMIDRKGKLFPALNEEGKKNSPYVRYVMATFGFVFRPNAYYRMLVQNRIHSFRYLETQPAFLPRTTCVAVHIRRGDRVIHTVDMIEYCRNYFKREDGVCMNKEGKQIDCQDIEDYGCFDVPFGSLSLSDYLEKAWLLLKTRNIFVMTDDAEWLLREKASVSKEWNIYGLSARENSRQHDSDFATENGVDFMASISIARQCQAFVGHWGSGVSHLVFQAMCFQHGLHTGHCPPACDMSADFRRSIS